MQNMTLKLNTGHLLGGADDAFKRPQSSAGLAGAFGGLTRGASTDKGTGKDEPAAGFLDFRNLTKQMTKVVSAASNKVQHKANF